jgi:hypothetical protein
MQENKLFHILNQNYSDYKLHYELIISTIFSTSLKWDKICLIA